jgi:hypothetical protein
MNGCEKTCSSATGKPNSRAHSSRRQPVTSSYPIGVKLPVKLGSVSQHWGVERQEMCGEGDTPGLQYHITDKWQVLGHIHKRKNIR